MFPVTAEINRQAAEIKAAIGQKMEDGTFYLGRFKNQDGTERDWFAAGGMRLTVNFNDAVRRAQESRAHDHDDWRLPPGCEDGNGEPDILQAIFNNNATIEFGKDTSDLIDRYWSSSPEVGASVARTQSSASKGIALKYMLQSARLVRSVPVP